MAKLRARVRPESPEARELAAKLAALEADKEARPDGWTKQKQAEHEALLQKKHEMRTVLGSARR